MSAAPVRNPGLPRAIQQSTQVPRSKLCYVCLNALANATEFEVTRYHLSLKSLQSSVTARCHLCTLVQHFLPPRPKHQLDEYMSLSLLWDAPSKHQLDEYLPFSLMWNERVDGTLLCGWRHAVESFSLVRKAFLSIDLEYYYKGLEEAPQTQEHIYKSFVGGMLSRCSSLHSNCWVAKQPLWTPTRLIEIRPDVSGIKLRLVDHRVNDLYMALSHCWGTSPPFQLLRENYAEMKKEIRFLQLPKTFRDAITIATWFEVRYIWIDSCCIIQNSTQDWLEESALMDNVYRNSYCTIAADASGDSSGGCIMNHSHLIIQPCEIQTPEGSMLCLPSKVSLQQRFENSPLEKRAWALQERILSPRVLHCTKEQLFWECNEQFSCQSYPYDLTSHGDFQKVPRITTQLLRADLLHQWNGVIEDYCKRSLTKEEDKLVALSGIAKVYQPRMANDIYLAGLWYKSLPHALLWRVVEATATKRPSCYRAPSWSWAAIDGRILPSRTNNNDLSIMRDACQMCLDIISSDLDLVSEDNTGQIRGGSLKVRGLLKRAVWSVASRRLMLFEESTAHDDTSATRLESPHGLSFFQDTEDISSSLNSTNLYCLLVEARSLTIDGLVIRSTGTSDHFVRVGTFHAAGAAAFDAVKYDKFPVDGDFEEQNRSGTAAMNIKVPSRPKARQPVIPNTVLPQPEKDYLNLWDTSEGHLLKSRSDGAKTPSITLPWSKKLSHQFAVSWRSETKTVHAKLLTEITDPSNIYLVDPPNINKKFRQLESRLIWLV